MPQNNTSYFVVYKKVLSELKDPHLKAVLDYDEISFCEIMYNFLLNAIPLFSDPFFVIKRLKDRTEPNISSVSYISDGMISDYKLPYVIPEDDVDNYLIRCKVDGENVKYTYTTETITLEVTPFEYSKIDIDVYFVGEWNIPLYEEETYILSQWVVVCWAEYTNNNKLDIDRLLGDTDFKLTSNSSTTTAKTAWYNSVRENASKRMNKFAWDARRLGLY